jgi:hypothetical protein
MQNGIEPIFLIVAWATLFLIIILASMLLGHAAGWILNAMLAKYVLKWPTEMVKAVYLRSELPTHWYKEGVNTPGDAEAFARREWEVHQRRGPLRFIAVRGVPGWGAPLFLAM